MQKRRIKVRPPDRRILPECGGGIPAGAIEAFRGGEMVIDVDGAWQEPPLNRSQDGECKNDRQRVQPPRGRAVPPANRISASYGQVRSFSWLRPFPGSILSWL